MKRRTFISASGTLGIASTVSGASIVSSVYSSMSTYALLEEFSPITRKTWDKFMADVALNIESLGLDHKVAKLIVNPVQIIHKKITGKDQNIVYKNKSGKYVSISVTKGIERIEVSNSL